MSIGYKFLETKKINGTKYTPNMAAFTLASSGDAQPTVTLRRLFAGGYVPCSDSKNTQHGDLVTAVVATQKTYQNGKGKTFRVNFYVNRMSKGSVTAKATTWPKELQKPKVGKPTNLVVLTAKLG
jgi:hypothetical protein